MIREPGKKLGPAPAELRGRFDLMALLCAAGSDSPLRGGVPLLRHGRLILDLHGRLADRWDLARGELLGAQPGRLAVIGTAGGAAQPGAAADRHDRPAAVLDELALGVGALHLL